MKTKLFKYYGSGCWKSKYILDIKAINNYFAFIGQEQESRAFSYFEEVDPHNAQKLLNWKAFYFWTDYFLDGDNNHDALTLIAFVQIDIIKEQQQHIEFIESFLINDSWR